VTLGGVQVLVNEKPAPLYAVSPGQVSAIMPFSTTGPTANVVIVNGGQRSNTVEVAIASTSPGVFTQTATGIGPGSIAKLDGTTVTAANPAKLGDIVQVYLTGLGAVNPPSPDGAAGPFNPVSRTTSDVKVYIAGQQAQVLFSGLAPTLVGLYQLNVTIPANIPTGTQPFAIQTPDAFHDQVDISLIKP